MTNLHSILKNRDTADKGLYRQSYGFSSSHVWMWELDNKNNWAPKNWCLQTTVLEKTFESPLNSNQIKSVNLKGNQPKIFTGRTDAEAKAPIIWLPDVKSLLSRKDPDAENNWRQEEKGMTEDEMVGWHHQLNGQEFEQTPRVGERQGSLTCCSLQCHRFRHDWETAQQQGPELSWYPHALSHMVFCFQIFRRPPGLYSVGSPCSPCSSPSLLSWAHGYGHTVTFPLLSCRVCALQEQRNSLLKYFPLESSKFDQV